MAGKPARNKKDLGEEAPKAESPKLSKGEFAAENSGSSKTGTVEKAAAETDAAKVEKAVAETDAAKPKPSKATAARTGKGSKSRQARDEKPQQSAAKQPKPSDEVKPEPVKPEPAQATEALLGSDAVAPTSAAKKQSSKPTSKPTSKNAKSNIAAVGSEAAAPDADHHIEQPPVAKSRPRHFRVSEEFEPRGKHSAEPRGKHSAKQDEQDEQDEQERQPIGRHMAHTRHSVEQELRQPDRAQEELRPLDLILQEAQLPGVTLQDAQLPGATLQDAQLPYRAYQEPQPLSELLNEPLGEAADDTANRTAAASAFAGVEEDTGSEFESGYRPGKYSYINLAEDFSNELEFEDVFGKDADTEFNTLFGQGRAFAGTPASSQSDAADEAAAYRQQLSAIEQAATRNGREAKHTNSKKPMRADKHAQAASRTNSTKPARRPLFAKCFNLSGSNGGFEDGSGNSLNGGFKPASVGAFAAVNKPANKKPAAFKPAKPTGSAGSGRPGKPTSAGDKPAANKPAGSGSGTKNGRGGKRRGTLLLVAGIAFILVAIGIGVFLVTKYLMADLSNQQAVEASGINLEIGSDSLAPDTPVEELSINWDSLRNINPDIVGWVIIPGTVINYPVVQTDNNDFYLNHIFDKTYNEAGSIFLDYENSPKIKGWNNIIYGHNLLDGKMFTSLKQYTDQDFYNEHKTILVATPEMNYKLEVVAVLVCDAEDKIRRFGFNSRQEYSEYVNMLTEYAVINDIGAQPPEYLYCFATCTGTNYMKRTMILAKLVEETPPPGSASGENGNAQGATAQGATAQGADAQGATAQGADAQGATAQGANGAAAA